MSHLILLCTLSVWASADPDAGAADSRCPKELIVEQWAPPHILCEVEVRMLARLVYTDMTVVFEDTSLKIALATVEHAVGFPLVVHYEETQDGADLDPFEKINLPVASTPALTVMEMILALTTSSDSGASWQLRNGFVEIGAKSRLSAAAAQHLRFYPVRDLLVPVPCFHGAPGEGELDVNPCPGRWFGGGSEPCCQAKAPPWDDARDPEQVERERAQEIIDLVTEIVEPDAWDSNGGDWAKIRYFGGNLIVQAPDFIHRQIWGYPFQPAPPADRPYSARRVLGFGPELTRIHEVPPVKAVDDEREDAAVDDSAPANNPGDASP